MGRVKDLLIQQQEQGWYFVGKNVCAHCFTDTAIRDFVTARAAANECDYCGSSAEQPIAAPIDDVLELMAGGLSVEWGDAVDELPYESAEGGYQGTTYYTREFFADVVEFPSENEGVREDIVSAFRDRLWCQRNYFGLSEQDKLLIGWKEFCDEVKHQRRYFFSNPRSASEPDAENEPNPLDFGDTPTASEVLREIAGLVDELGLVKTIAPGHVFARARNCDPKSPFTTAADLGAAPVEKAVCSNRMSPSGVPMFYGSEDVRTAVAETRDGSNSLSVGLFETVRELRLLDLTDLPTTPSVFLAEASDLRIRITFLKRFVHDLKNPIAKDGMEHIDYVPTQVVTEYFRHIFRDEAGRGVDGILYPSAKVAGGVNCVIFCGSDNCCEGVPPKWEAERMWLHLKEVCQVP